MTAETIQKLVMIMDMHGYEQDGDGPVFADLHSSGGLIRFPNWDAVAEFVCTKLAKG